MVAIAANSIDDRPAKPRAAGIEFDRHRAAEAQGAENACDCHMHIYDAARFPMPPSARSSVQRHRGDYRMLQKRIGTTRVVVVQPRKLRHRQPRHGSIDRAARPERERRRGLHPTVTETELGSFTKPATR